MKKKSRCILDVAISESECFIRSGCEVAATLLCYVCAQDLPPALPRLYRYIYTQYMRNFTWSRFLFHLLISFSTCSIHFPVSLTFSATFNICRHCTATLQRYSSGLGSATPMNNSPTGRDGLVSSPGRRRRRRRNVAIYTASGSRPYGAHIRRISFAFALRPPRWAVIESYTRVFIDDADARDERKKRKK